MMDPRIYDVDELRRKLAPPVICCEHCGSSAEHVEMMAFVAGIADPICCDWDYVIFEAQGWKVGEPWTAETARRRIGGTFGT